MSEQTPSTEDVQSAATQCPDGITPAEWDAWLTTYTRAVKAEALREAAENIRNTWMRLEIEGLGNVIVGSPDSIARHIEARADRIEDER